MTLGMSPSCHSNKGRFSNYWSRGSKESMGGSQNFITNFSMDRLLFVGNVTSPF